MITPETLSALETAVGPKWFKRTRAELEIFATDGLPTHGSTPGAVVIPGCREELLRVMRILHQHRVPAVARGAGTGLSGGALAAGDAVLVVLTRLNRILEIDVPNRRAVVEPGVVNSRLSNAVEQFGLHYAPDPSSQPACTIGGNVAENAGGPHCLKYGVTSNHILALEVVLPDGEVLSLGSPNGEPWGPDLVGLFVGSEGTLGIATAITVRLTPIQRAVRTLLADYTMLRSAGEAVSSVIAAGFIPAALEILDRNTIAAIEASIYSAGYPTDAGAVLLVELDGMDEAAVEAEARQVEALLHAAGARSIQFASDPVKRDRLWHGRKKAFGAMGRLGSDLVVQDAAVPRSMLPSVLEQIGDIGRRYSISICNVFHAGDGNLHPNMAFDRADAGLFGRVKSASSEIMHLCIEAGGTITGEHGVGIDKIHYMPLVYDPDTLGAMAEIREVFDPLDLANPGKVLPAHFCREHS